MIRRSVAASSASSSSWRSSLRGSRSPTCGSSRIRSSPSRGALRGKTPSSRPSRQTTRCGTERIGTSVQIVRWPVRKFARVGRPWRRSASSARISGSASGVASTAPPAVASSTTSSRMPLRARRAARRRARRVAVSASAAVGDRGRPRVDRLRRARARRAPRCSRSTSSAKRPARSIAPLSTSSSGSTPPNRRWSSSVIVTPTQHAVQARPPGAGGELVELERRAVRGVEAPADAARRDPVLASARGRRRRSRKRRRTGSRSARSSTCDAVSRCAGQVEQLGDDAEHRVGLAQRAVGQPHAQVRRADARPAARRARRRRRRPRRRRTSPGSAARTSRCPGT